MISRRRRREVLTPRRVEKRGKRRSVSSSTNANARLPPRAGTAASCFGFAGIRHVVGGERLRLSRSASLRPARRKGDAAPAAVAFEPRRDGVGPWPGRRRRRPPFVLPFEESESRLAPRGARAVRREDHAGAVESAANGRRSRRRGTLPPPRAGARAARPRRSTALGAPSRRCGHAREVPGACADAQPPCVSRRAGDRRAEDAEETRPRRPRAHGARRCGRRRPGARSPTRKAERDPTRAPSPRPQRMEVGLVGRSAEVAASDAGRRPRGARASRARRRSSATHGELRRATVTSRVRAEDEEDERPRGRASAARDPA